MQLCIACILITPLITHAEPYVLRIGTGGSAGTYLPIGTLIANSITGPNNFHKSKSYFEPDLIAIAQRAAGSGSNVEDISQGLLEGGLAQADVVHWAFNGSGPFKGKPPRKNLRGIATLYLESVHLIARNGADISSIQDLEGKLVSLDEQGSGTRLDALTIMEANGLSTNSFNAVYLKTADAIDRLRRDELDAFFIIAGYPVNAVSKLIAEGRAQVVPISGPLVDALVADYPYFSNESIPENTYQNPDTIQTIGVPAQLITSSRMDEQLIYNITSMLWSETTLNLLSLDHSKGKDVQLETALIGMDVPLHPGAKRFYQEQGMLTGADE